MRLSLVSVCLFAIAPSAFAETDHNAPGNYTERSIPKNQYEDWNRNSVNNGRIVKERPTRYIGSDDYDLNFGIEGGYRTSQLRLQIGGDGVTVPNILSEVKWKNINGYEAKPGIEYTQKTGSLKGLNLQASVNKSITTSGKNQDSDYAGNNRTAEFSRSNNSSDAGHAEGFSASIGYAFNFSDDRNKNYSRFTALVGYAMQNQRFVARDGFQVIPAIGAFPGLRSSYDMELSMPFIGGEYYNRFADVHSIRINAKFSRTTLNGTGHWNLRNDFAQPDSFTQDADGYAFMLGAKYGWNFRPDLKLTLATDYNYFRSSSGNDTVYLANGTIINGGFREVRFSSIDYMAGLNYSF